MVIRDIFDPSDSCEEPVCPDEIEVRILGLECTGAEIVASWTVDGATLNPIQNQLLWSVNNQEFNNIELSQTNTPPYLASFPIPASAGIIFSKAKSLVGSTFYESPVNNLNIGECDDTSTYVIPSTICTLASDNSSDLTGSVFSNIWVKEEGVPRVSDGAAGMKRIHFKYNGECLFIDDDNFNAKILLEDATGQIILDAVSFDYASCSDCSNPLSSSCDFVEDSQSGTSDFTKIYTISTTQCLTLNYELTGHALSQIIVTNLATGEILFDSTCMRTTEVTSTDITVTGISQIKIVIDTVCEGRLDASWFYILRCCEE